ncbi:MAG: sensor domain-containing diguanylate cyclase [Pseudomonadota bacterium]
MTGPATPFNEAARLASLHSLHILDTSPDERFDRVSRVARALFQVPAALVSLVDSDRVWYKSRLGVDTEQTGRDASFCGLTILQDEIFVVEDMLDDERFGEGSPYVEANPNRFYAGCPISGPGGQHIGTLCVIDPEPRIFSDGDKSLLKDLAKMVEDELLLLHETTSDELTRLKNRRGFSLYAEHMLGVARRDRMDARLAYFDLDGFKVINDTLGHDTGDEMLKAFAEVLESTFRRTDVIARLGGDEFAVLMTGNKLNSDAALMRLGENTNTRNETLDRNILWSVGLVDFRPDDHRTMEDLMAEADERMYEHKSRRRTLGFI